MKILELGHVVFYVTNLKNSLHFYKDILGFKLIHSDAQIALFSAGRTHHEMLLIEIGGTARPKHAPEPGLYHVGLKIGNGPEAARVAYKELKKQGVTILGTGDHGVTHSIYILDPDGNELELYADVSDEWKTNTKAVLAPTRALHLD